MTRLMQVDVFCTQRLSGNPLAVFVDPPDLPAALYQAWAREMNLSESIFVWPDGPDRYRARIFTPVQELGFAGHPTLGAAWVLRELGWLLGPSATQVTEAGSARVFFDPGGTIWLEPPVRELGELVDPAAAGAALGIPTLWMVPALPPQAASVGVGHLIVQLQPGHVATLRPNLGRVTALLEEQGLAGVLAWTFSGAGRVHSRLFAPVAGVLEDPATGSAAAALGVVLTQAAGVTEPTRYTISQGSEVGRPSELLLAINQTAPGSIAVGGRVVPVFSADVDMNPQADARS